MTSIWLIEEKKLIITRIKGSKNIDVFSWPGTPLVERFDSYVVC
jgi:hypothetical protein